MRRASPIVAFAVAVCGIAVFSSMDAVMKGLTLAIGVYTSLMWRCVAATLLSGALYAASRPRLPSRHAIRIHLVRGVVSALMAVTFFWGLARVPMAQAVALTFIAPLLSLVLSALLLGERVSRRVVTASVLALAGVAVILIGQWRADMGPAALHGAIAILLSAAAYAFNIVLMRRQAQMAGPLEVAFAQSLVVVVVLAIGAPVFATIPEIRHVPMIVLAAFQAVASLLLLAWAYARAEASYLSASEYTAFVWAALFGFLFFGEHVALPTLAGAALIVAACIHVARERPTGLVEIEAAL